MEVRVRFRFNTHTGQVEEFRVDQDSHQHGAAHDAAHDRLAADLGRLLERDPAVEEILPHGAQTQQEREPEPEPETRRDPNRDRQSGGLL